MQDRITFGLVLYGDRLEVRRGPNLKIPWNGLAHVHSYHSGCRGQYLAPHDLKYALSFCALYDIPVYLTESDLALIADFAEKEDTRSRTYMTTDGKPVIRCPRKNAKLDELCAAAGAERYCDSNIFGARVFAARDAIRAVLIARECGIEIKPDLLAAADKKLSRLVRDMQKVIKFSRDDLLALIALFPKHAGVLDLVFLCR